MSIECTIQLFADGCWHDVASVLRLGAEQAGYRAQTYTGYAVEWALDRAGATDAWALCSQLPVSLQPTALAHWPPFLIDMLPQGNGREELLRQLGLPETAHESADWPLLMAGAGNPIGHLRVKEAAAWLNERRGPQRGFADAEVALRSDDFTHYLGEHGLFVAGSSGIQGEWPKVLLTRAQDGLLYLDHSLADSDGMEHFIVKFGRGANPQLAKILRHEAIYMRVAEHLGLRVHRQLTLSERALFVPRFDRKRVNGHLVRLAQESLATLTGLAGFGAAPPHEVVCQKLLSVCNDPAAEVLEYLRRDVANLAMGNKDNHARNTALQRDFDGRIALTPLFDFAPMYLHPDGIARRMQWGGRDGGAPDWTAVLDMLCVADVLQRGPLAAGLQAMAPRLREVLRHGADWGLEADVLAFLTPAILGQIQALEQIR